MRRSQHLIGLVSVFILFGISAHSTQAQQSQWKFSLLPQTGDISGQPGKTIGWGYSIENNSSDKWLLVLDFRTSVPLQHGILYGIYLSNPPLLAPGSKLSVPYEHGTDHGFLSFKWDENAPIGYVNAGNFFIGGGWYSGDPFDGGNLIGDAGEEIVSYQASVTGLPTPVPEPSVYVVGGVAAICLTALLLWKRKRLRRTA